MRLKPGVITTGIQPELLTALMVAEEVYRDHGQPLVITSLNDSKHSVTSLHYAGCAADLRTRDFHNPNLIVSDIRAALGGNPDYDVIYEVDHIHIEWQPKRRDR